MDASEKMASFDSIFATVLLVATGKDGGSRRSLRSSGQRHGGAGSSLCIGVCQVTLVLGLYVGITHPQAILQHWRGVGDKGRVQCKGQN